MDTRRLGYFMRIAEDGSLTKASGVLRIAQPALSRQMRLLEEELGVSLFVRTARGMRLTEDGEYLRGSVAGPLRELELALQNIGARNAAAEANFALGLSQNLAEALAAPLAFGLRARFPKVKFCIVDGINGSLIDWLGRGIIDFALLEELGHDEQLSEQTLASLPLALLGPAKAAAAFSIPAGKSVTLAAALQLPLVLTSHHLGLRGVINDAAARLKIKLDVRFQADASKLIRDLVAQSVGYSLLPQCYFRDADLSGLKIWPITGPTSALDIVLSSRRSSNIAGRQFSEVERAISDIAIAVLPEQQRGKRHASK